MTARDPMLRPTAGAVRDSLDGSSTEPHSITRTAVLPAAAVAAALETMPARALDHSAAVATISNGAPPGRRRARALVLALGGAALVAVLAAALWVAGGNDPANAPAISPQTSLPTTTEPTPVTTVSQPTLPPAIQTTAAGDSGHGNGNEGRGNGHGNKNEGRGNNGDG